jgi:hypothetical protein
MPIDDTRRPQSRRQGLLVELGIVPRTWDRPDIHELRHSMRLQKVEELSKRSRRMSDRQHNHVALRDGLLLDRHSAAAVGIVLSNMGVGLIRGLHDLSHAIIPMLVIVSPGLREGV